MANTIRHKHTGINPSTASPKPDDIDGANWLEEHILNAPEIGSVLVGDPSQSDGVGWVLPGDAGFVLVTMGGGTKPVWEPVSFDVVLTVPGDLARGRAGTGVSERLAVGLEGQVLKVTGGMPEWGNVVPPGGVVGDILYVNAPGELALRPIGTPGQVLAVIGGLPKWSSLPASFANPMTTLGDMIVALAGGTPQRLGIGVNTQVLTVVGGVPAWANPTGGGGGSLPITTPGDLVAGDASGLPVRLPVGGPGQVLTAMAGGGKLVWATPVVAMTNPMLSPADLIVGGVAGAPARLAKGADTHVLTVVAGALAWAAPAVSGMVNPMTASGDVIIGGASGTPLRLAKGTDTHVLTLVGGVPAWVVAPGAGGGMTNPMTSLGDIIYGLAAGVPQRLAPAANGQFLTLSAGIPAWATLPVDPGFANPMTTIGDMIVGGGSGVPTRMAASGSNGYVLTLSGGTPMWTAPTVYMTNPMTAVGDIIIGGTAGAPTKLVAGADGFMLKLLSGVPTWQPAPAGLTWPLLAPNGSVAAPSYSFVSNPNAGMFIDGAGHLTLATSGSSLIALVRNSGVAWWVDSLGGWQPGTDAGYDIGAIATRVRDVRFSRQALAADGTFTAPSYSFAGDNTMGLYRSGGSLVVESSSEILFALGSMSLWKIGISGAFLPAISGVDIGSFAAPVRQLWLDQYVDYAVMATPATPSAGHVVTYAKSDKKMYQKDDAGVETPLGGGSGGANVVRLPLEQATLPDGTGTINNPPEMAREVTVGTQTTNTPKATRTTANFDQSVDEHLQWAFMLPSNYVSGGTIRLKWKAYAATTGNVVWKAGAVATVDGSSDDDASVFTAADLAAASPAPAVQGQSVEVTIALTTTGFAANRRVTVFVGRDADNAADTMAGSGFFGDAVLMGVRFEYA